MTENKIFTKPYPLSATENLAGHRMEVYTDTLQKAISHPDIYSIAITGDTGIGKSSIIRSHMKDSKQRFATLSMAEYSFEFQEANNKKNEQQKEAAKEKLEKSLLRQILSLCRKKDIPSSAMELIPEDRYHHHAKILGISIAVYILLWLTELNSTRVSEMIRFVFGEVRSLAGWRIGLECSIAILTVVLVAYLIYKLFAHLHVKQVSAELSGKFTKVSASAEARQTFSLEKYRMELTYVFEKISKRYNAIVFEDMDRIDDGTAIEILTYLKEINTSVNERLMRGIRLGIRKPKISHLSGKIRRSFYKRKLCFIYVINENMVSKFDYHKYIDFGLSIIPTLSQSNAKDSVDLLLKDMPGFDGDSIYDNSIHEYRKLLEGLIENVHSLSDFRKIYQIKNDYIIFHKALLYSNNAAAHLLDECNERLLMSFMIYKNLLPDDYSRIRLSKNNIFQDGLPKKGKPLDNEKRKNYELIKRFLIETTKIVIDKGAPSTIGLSSYLSFIGFSEDKKREKCFDYLTKEEANKKIAFFKEDIKDECLTIKVFRNTNDKNIQRKICRDIEDLFLKYLLEEYVKAKMRTYTDNTPETNQAKANIIYYCKLIRENKPTTPPTLYDDQFTELKDYISKNKSDLNIFHDTLNEYSINMDHEQQLL